MKWDVYLFHFWCICVMQLIDISETVVARRWSAAVYKISIN